MKTYVEIRGMSGAIYLPTLVYVHPTGWSTQKPQGMLTFHGLGAPE